MAINHSQKILEALEKVKDIGVFTRKEAISAGISQPTLSRLTKARTLLGLGNGLFCHPETQSVDLAELDFIAASKRFGPHSFIGGMTSLYHYHLITQVPNAIWVVVPPNIKTTRKKYRCIRTTNDLAIGVENRKFYRIATVERSIVDAFVFRTKIGLSTALRAARTAIMNELTTEKKIYSMAKALGAWNAVEHYWEALRDDRFD